MCQEILDYFVLTPLGPWPWTSSRRPIPPTLACPEVHPALGARELLAEQSIGARVASMPSGELFDQQSKAYRHQVLPPSVAARLAVEAGVTQG